MSSTTDDTDKLAQALAHLESERDRRVQQRVLSGEARLIGPLVVGASDTVLEPDGDGVVRGFLLAEGAGIERLSRIVTGVPRCGRDVPLEPHHLQRAAPPEEAPWWKDRVGKMSHQEHVWESEPIGPWIDIGTSIGGKNDSDPGRIIPGSYRHKGNNFIEVRGDDGKSLGVHAIKSGDDILVFAKKLLREGRNTQFWDGPIRTSRIPY